ncbi:MAG TPA: hypothetical protein VN962_26320 [Polyangia bacterium]|nr:hypothetical protein [Polyangia bacterium]
MTLAVGPLACSSSGEVNIGDTQQLGSKLSDYAASWDGYAEAYAFSTSGSDRVRLVLDESGSGTLRVGDDTLLPPPTDASVGYPPTLGASGAQTSQVLTLRDDFVYPIHSPRLEADRIQLGLDDLDFYAAWCALQTPVVRDPSSADSSYGCLPNLGGFSHPDGTCGLTNTDGSTIPVDCGKLSLCNLQMLCVCTATACSIPTYTADQPPAQYPEELDAALDSTGQNLTGTLTVGGTRVTVHLQRQ